LFLFPFPWKLKLIYTPIAEGRNNFFKAFVAADVSPLILKKFEPTYVGCYGQKPLKTGLFRAQTGYLPHRWIYARTDGKLARTERPIARTDRIIAARTGKWPHGTTFQRTELKLFRTD
jgi:hypothetical protein